VIVSLPPSEMVSLDMAKAGSSPNADRFAAAGGASLVRTLLPVASMSAEPVSVTLSMPSGSVAENRDDTLSMPGVANRAS
jgi:hypothetical protein